MHYWQRVIVLVLSIAATACELTPHNARDVSSIDAMQGELGKRK